MVDEVNRRKLPSDDPLGAEAAEFDAVIAIATGRVATPKSLMYPGSFAREGHLQLKVTAFSYETPTVIFHNKFKKLLKFSDFFISYASESESPRDVLGMQWPMWGLAFRGLNASDSEVDHQLFVKMKLKDKNKKLTVRNDGEGSGLVLWFVSHCGELEGVPRERYQLAIQLNHELKRLAGSAEKDMVDIYGKCSGILLVFASYIYVQLSSCKRRSLIRKRHKWYGFATSTGLFRWSNCPERLD